jgi:RNA polymerase sigma-70 factor (sigma-E family)
MGVGANLSVQAELVRPDLGPAGGPMAFEDFFAARNRRLLELAWLITRDPEDARDAVQDALAGLYRRWSLLPSGDEFEAYVHRSVVNACLAVLRRRRRWLPVAAPEQLRAAPVSDDFTEQVGASAHVWQLCGELRPAQRAAVVLRFWSDASYAEIAAALGCTESTARSHVHRAIAALRERLAGGDE